MPRYRATVTVDGKQYNAKATADNPASAYQKICASAASAFPGKTITVGYATKEDEPEVNAGIPDFFKGIFK